MRVAIAGGGTGGHLFPGIAVAEEFRQRREDVEVIFIGTEKGLESRIIPREGYPIKLLRSEGVLGKSLMRQIWALYRAVTAVFASMTFFRDARPDIVIGTGGYVSVGPVVAARLLQIPVLLMEQNMVPGLANRMLSKVADMVAVTYHESTRYFGRGKAVRAGNPVRKSVLKGDREKAMDLFSLEPGRLTVLVLGGSSGARKLNETLAGALGGLLSSRDGIQFLHQTGQSDFERMKKAYRDMGFKAMVAPFIHQMAEAYAVADIVISRAGATTLAELTALGKPMLLVPYPHAAGHQEHNASKVVEVGGARLLREHELTAEVMAGHLRELYSSEELRGEMRRHSRTHGRGDAAARVVDLAVSIMRARGANV
jgi:UDP-N-acetylglucosamine--N-acetylmuramyl-(pentapeptide) pyrophosphoryl-undecaprenol N-acetylglucosamine transferase